MDGTNSRIDRVVEELAGVKVELREPKTRQELIEDLAKRVRKYFYIT